MGEFKIRTRHYRHQILVILV